MHNHLPFLPVSLEAPASDVHTLSCPPLSIHLHHSHPPPFLCHQLQPALLPLSINLSPPSASSPLSVCLLVPPTNFILSVRVPPFAFTPFILPSLYNFAPYVSIPLVLCHSLSVPHLFSTLLGLISPLPFCCIKKFGNEQAAAGSVCLSVLPTVFLTEGSKHRGTET